MTLLFFLLILTFNDVASTSSTSKYAYEDIAKKLHLDKKRDPQQQGQYHGKYHIQGYEIVIERQHSDPTPISTEVTNEIYRCKMLNIPKCHFTVTRKGPDRVITKKRDFQWNLWKMTK